MTPLALAVLGLLVHLDGPTPLRLVADAPDAAWSVDGDPVAVTQPGSPAIVQADAGPHRIEATADTGGPWRILVRPEPAVGEGAAYVPGWSNATQGLREPGGSAGAPAWLLPAAVAACGALLLVSPRPGVAGRRSRP